MVRGEKCFFGNKFFIFLTVLFVITTQELILCIEITQQNSIKVSNKFYGGFGSCFLSRKDVSPKVNPRIACVNMCKNTQNCHLVCVDGVTCHLYRATVAPYYDHTEMDSLGPAKVNAPGVCYTLWLFPNDITDSISEIYATSIPIVDTNVYGRLLKKNAIDGYSCDVANVLYYHSIHSADGLITPIYLELRFPSIVKVSQVYIKPRSAIGTQNWFKNMEMRVGNGSGIGNFYSNVQIGNRVISHPNHDETLIIYDGSANPIVGKIVIIRQMDISSLVENYLVIEELKVIGKKIN